MANALVLMSDAFVMIIGAVFLMPDGIFRYASHNFWLSDISF